MAWLFSKRGTRLQKQTESILKRAESDIAKTADIRRLHQTLSELNAHLGTVSVEIANLISNDASLIIVRSQLVELVNEARQIEAVERKTKDNLVRMRQLMDLAKRLKEEEDKYQAALNRLKKDEMHLRQLDEQADMLENASHKVTLKIGELLYRMNTDAAETTAEINRFIAELGK